MSAIFDEHAALSRNTHVDISGLNYSILKEKRVRTMAISERNDRTGNASACLKIINFTHHPKKRIIHSVPDTNQSRKPDENFPLILTTGRIRDQWHTMSRTGKVNKLKQHISESFLEINPADADSRKYSRQ